MTDGHDAGTDTDGADTHDGDAGAGRVRVAVVDDHEMFRRGVIDTIRNDCDVVGQAADVDGAVAMIARTRPDVVLLDVHVPGGSGGGGAEIILRAMPQAPDSLYLALSVSDAPADVGAVIRAGARGYVTKTITAADLIASIHQVAEGYAVFSPRLAGFVLSALRPDADHPAPPDDVEDGARNDTRAPTGPGLGIASGWGSAHPRTVPDGPDAPTGGRGGRGTAREGSGASGAFAGGLPGAGSATGVIPGTVSRVAAGARGDAASDADVSLDALTPREQQVMRLIARGYTYKEVASELFISVKTVETHMSAVLRKLQLSNRGELARWAAHRNIV